MYKMLKNIILFSIVFILIPISFAQFQTYTLNLELIEGGCIGYENSLVQVYYQNGSLLNNSEFTVEIYDGPVRTMGLFTSFEVGAEPAVLTFESPTNYFYSIRVPNDNNTYLGTEGFIEIFDCGVNNFKIIQTFESLLTIESNFDPQISIISEIEHSIKELENEFVIKILEIDLTPFIRNTDTIELISNRNMWTSSDLEVWEKINSSTQISNLNLINETYLAIQSTQIIRDESEQESNETIALEENEQESNETTTTPQPPRPESVQEIQSFSNTSGNSSLIIIFIIISVLILTLVGFIYMKNSSSSSNSQEYYSSNNDNNSITLNTHQLPNLMQSRIIAYIETYQEYYSSEQIIEQLIQNGFQREVIIEVLQKFVNNKNN